MAAFVSPMSALALQFFQLNGFMGQMSASYNLFSISIAEDVMSLAGIVFKTWASDLQYTAIYGGSILGMTLMGYVGDRVGRAWAMNVTLLLTVIGALGSGLLVYGSTADKLVLISGFRFVLGWGIGGTYPLSSAGAGDKTAGQCMDIRRYAMGWSYFGQGPGNVGPYVWVLLLNAVGLGYTCMWRTVLAVGAVPALCVFSVNGIRPEADRAVFKNRQLKDKSRFTSQVWQRLCSREYVFKLLGTGGSWFMYDFVTNSVKTLAPTILKDIFDSGSLPTMCWENILLNGLSIPAMLATMYCIPLLGPRKMIILSALVQSVLFFLLCVMLGNDTSTNLTFVTFCVLYFFQSYGVGMCNYMVAAEMFPIEVRSTFAGISAGLGKLGAIYGIVVMNGMLESFGDSAGMAVMAFAALFFAWISWMFIDEKTEMENDLTEEGVVATTPLMSDHNDNRSASQA